ncbi:hypothetical protein [Nocardia sp. NBC_01009]|uniref:hypothetical protein n=1 Tax=Nocardia sp. NBC_01009 TaxID=2975996 RepID=UPI00386D47A8|nr:hypothetical protein OHA42_09700 [Nocardia sp. NBC_01009]
MNPPLDPTIVDLLRGSALAPLIDRPVNDILKDMGLGPLPEISGLPPLPELPPLPVIDLSALARPLTDLASSFGTGALGAGAGGGTDPTQALSGITTALQTAMTLGATAVQTVMSMWQGMAAMQAAEKATQAQEDGGKVAAQGTQEKAVLGTAATSVATGGALLAAIIAKYLATMTAAAPLLGTPGGQLFLVAASTEALTEATAVVAKTRVEMTGHSANMTQTGQKVKVTNAPKGVDSAQQMAQMMQMLTPLMTLATTGVQTASQLATASSQLLAPKPADVAAKAEEEADRKAREEDAAKAEASGGGGGFGGGGFGGGGIGGGGIGGVAAASTPLSPYSGTRVASMGPLPGASSLGTGSSAMEPGGGVRPGGSAPGSPGMMPYGAAGAAGSRAGDAGSDLPGFLVSGQHGDEVVGDIDGVSLPVVGATEQASEPPPDKELTL